MGHVLNNTLQDILVRFHRMDGYERAVDAGDRSRRHRDAERRREAAREGGHRPPRPRPRGVRRARLGSGRNEYGSTILRQLKRLGASCDWARERFTMDAGLSQAVREVFVRLYDEGLIYRGQRIINWCPRCQTALSDEEAVTTEGGEPGSLWHIRYPAEDGGDGRRGGDDAAGDDARRHRRGRESRR